MGLRFRQTYTEDGDILDGLGWVLDNSELAGEVNGSLDRDNLPANTISRGEIVSNAFTEVYFFSQSLVFAPDPNTTEWQGHGSLNAGILSVSFDAEQDCVVTVELVVQWGWATTTDSYDPSDTTCNAFQGRITVDGAAVAVSEWHDDTRQQDHMSLIAVAVINAGHHTVKADCRLARVACTTDTISDVVTDTLEVRRRTILITQEKR